MSESNTNTCKVCNKNKTRIAIGKYPSGNKKYVNEENHEWSGKTCPSCHKSKVAKSMKRLRNERNPGDK